MKYTNISIENFRDISHLSLTDFKTINVFVGKNNCGKTSVLEALFVLSGPTNPLPITINKLRGYKGTFDKEIFEVLFKNLDTQQTINLSCEFDSSETRILDIAVIKGQQKNGDTVFAGNDSDYFIKGLKLTLTINNSHTKKNKYVTQVVETERTVDTDTTPKGYVETLKTTFLNPLSMLQAFSEFSGLKKRRQDKEIIGILQQVDARIQGIELIDDTIYCDIGNNAPLVPIHIMGDGLKHLLAIVIIMYSRQGGVVFIDEIDNGLYHETQTVLWQTVLTAAERFNVQVFATTHSWECLSALANVTNSLYTNKDEVRVYRIEKENTNHKAVKIRQEILANVVEKNWEVR